MPWPEILLVVGVSTYVSVLERMGTIDFVGHGVAGLTSPLVAALLLCFVGQSCRPSPRRRRCSAR
ncbi:hypothetical protein ACE0DR_11120 [Azotobacter sp. CWF10]